MHRDGRPFAGTLQVGLWLIAIGVVRTSQPHSWLDPGAFAVVVGCSLAAWYIDRLARWLKS